MEVDNLVETTIANYQEERPVVHLDAVVNEDADPLINLLLHLNHSFQSAYDSTLNYFIIQSNPVNLF